MLGHSHLLIEVELDVQVVCCPGGLVTGFTRFIPNEEQLESSVITRAHMEGQLVVALAGRSVFQLPL